MTKIRLTLFYLGFIALVMAQVGCSSSYVSDNSEARPGVVQLGRNIFRVSVPVRGSQDLEHLTNLCMTKCARLTIQKGYKYFSVVENLGGGAVAADQVLTSEDGHSYLITTPGPSNMIICHRSYPASGFAYDAKFTHTSQAIKDDPKQEMVARQAAPTRRKSKSRSRGFPKFLKPAEESPKN